MVTAKAPIQAKKITDDYVREPFVYQVGDVSIELPSLSWIKPGTIRKIRRMSQLDQMYTLFELYLGPKELEAIDDMDPGEFEDFCKAWREHSGVSLGES